MCCKLVSLLVLYGVEYHQVICQQEVGEFLYYWTRGTHKELTFMLTTSCVLDCVFVTLSKVVVFYNCGNEDYEITSVLYCVVIHRYTQCYTSVILGVIHLLLYAPVYSVPIRNVILKRITCV
jgi:hypothetical protein